MLLCGPEQVKRALPLADTAIKLRVALALASYWQPAWIQALVRRLLALPFVDLCLIIIEPAPLPHPSTAQTLLWRMYKHLDDKLFGKDVDFLAQHDLRKMLTGVTSVELDTEVPAQTETLDLLMTQRLDVIIHLGLDKPQLSLAHAARRGVWWHAFGLHRAAYLDLVGMREVFEREPVTVTDLIQLQPDGKENVLYHSVARTILFSPRKNRDNVFGKSVAFAEHKLRELSLQGRVEPCSAALQNGSHHHPVTVPDSREMLRASLRVSADMAYRGWQKLTSVDQWFLAFKFHTDTDLPYSLSGFQPMMPPKDRFWADPFPIERDGRHFVFIEELPFATNKGHISVMEVWPNGKWTKPVKVLERDYHLSYPFLFEWQGTLFMLPETGENRTVEVYRCHRFPDDWRLEAVLLEEICSADATIFPIDDQWWMFVTIGQEGTERYDELHLFHADQPFGQWTPHPLNPVKSDVFSARPAGQLFAWQGALYRPAQVSAPLYGSAISLNKIERIDSEHFVEREVARLNPDWHPGLLGCHTYNRAGNLIMIDGFQRTPRWQRNGHLAEI